MATNLIQVESGTKYFMEKRIEYPELYSDDIKNEKWKAHLSYMEQNKYYPQSCDKYCPYHEECAHCKNILSTIHTKRRGMERIAGYHEKFYSMEEMQEDVYDAISRAYHAIGKKYYIIKAMTGAGKSHSYIKLMREYPDERFLIAVPTNLLKDEILEKAKGTGIKAMKTPSLEAIMNKIPSTIKKRIQKLYKRGQHQLVHPYIKKVLEKKELEEKDILCLRKYMEKREKLKVWKGCVITTHRYLLSMDKERLDEFDSIIIDEDILFKSVISNQGEISVSDLKRLKKETTDPRLSNKIKKLLKASETQSCMPKAIRAYTDRTDIREQIADLMKNRNDIFLEIFAKIVPFGNFYKKDKAVEIICGKIGEGRLRRRMLRLVALIPEKKSLCLAQKAMEYRNMEKVMRTFAEINVSPVTISKRQDVKWLKNVYEYLAE